MMDTVEGRRSPRLRGLKAALLLAGLATNVRFVCCDALDLPDASADVVIPN
jgi:hypothetical protein